MKSRENIEECLNCSEPECTNCHENTKKVVDKKPPKARKKRIGLREKLKQSENELVEAMEIIEVLQSEILRLNGITKKGR